MSQKTKTQWIGPEHGIAYEVPAPPEFTNELLLVNERRDGQIGDAMVNLRDTSPVAVKADGTRLHVKGNNWFLITPPCGGKSDDCGCGCHGGWVIVMMTAHKAAVWAHDNGLVTDDFADRLQEITV